jgi:hypothetical protein
MLNRFKMIDCKPSRTPQEVGLQLSNSMSPKTDSEKNEMLLVPYKEAVGSLIYAMLGTRPDIAQSCSEVSRYMSNPGLMHWTAVKRILRYLKGTVNTGLVFSGSNTTLFGYTDSDWRRSIDDRRSTSGYIFMTNNCAISWKSKKQTTVALSTMEAEYIAISDAVKEVLWLNKLKKEISHDSKSVISLFVDNQSCLNFAKNPGQHSRAKHIDIRYNFVKEAVQSKEVDLRYCSTENNIADALTKPLTKERFEKHCNAMGMK